MMVNAPVEAIWSMLVDKAEHPEKYLPYQPEFLKIHETFPNGLLREIKTAQMHLLERVTFDKDAGMVKFSLENHPVYTGAILDKVTPPEAPGGLPLLTFTMDLQPRSETAEQQPEAQWFLNTAKPDMIHYAVNLMKEIMGTNLPASRRGPCRRTLSWWGRCSWRTSRCTWRASSSSITTTRSTSSAISPSYTDGKGSSALPRASSRK
jgi:hypothetical protein